MENMDYLKSRKSFSWLKYTIFPDNKQVFEDDSDENDDYLYSSSTGGKILKENFLVNDQGIKLSPYYKKAPANIKFDDSNIQLR